MASSDFISAGRIVNGLAPASIAAAGPIQSDALDTKGFRWAVITLNMGVNQSTADGTASVQFAPTSGGTYVTATGAVFTILPTDDDKVLTGVVDLEQMDRWLQVNGATGTGGAGTIMGVTITMYGVVNTSEYIDRAAGGVDELAFTVLTP